MGNQALRRSQTIVELVIAFVIASLLFAGGFRLWSGLEKSLISDTTDYQDKRVEAGSGDIDIPGQDIFPAEFTDVDDVNIAMIVDIQQCECLDDRTKESAENLYAEQYEAELEMESYDEAVKELEDSMVTLQEAWNMVPWCSQCCLCKLYCYSSPGDYSTRYDYWVVCRGSAQAPCRSCRQCTWLPGGCGNLVCPENNSSASCRAIKKNMTDEHSVYRQQIEDEIDNLQNELWEAEDNYNRAKANKRRTDSRIDKLDLSCCGL